MHLDNSSQVGFILADKLIEIKNFMQLDAVAISSGSQTLQDCDSLLGAPVDGTVSLVQEIIKFRMRSQFSILHYLKALQQNRVVGRSNILGPPTSQLHQDSINQRSFFSDRMFIRGTKRKICGMFSAKRGMFQLPLNRIWQVSYIKAR
jgi:hypothetical protein